MEQYWWVSWIPLGLFAIAYLVGVIVTFRFFYNHIYNRRDVLGSVVMGMGWFVTMPMFIITQLVIPLLLSTLFERRR